VYDLTVEDAHCFYAEGVLVGNCHDALQYVATRLFGQGLLSSAQEPEHRRDRYARRLQESESWLTV
jgi:hypothetical protein